MSDDDTFGYGPLFWTTDLEPNGSPIVQAASPSGEAFARKVVIDAWAARGESKPTLAMQQIAQAIFRFEGGYGKGWKGSGVGSHNWGAVQCCLPGTKGANPGECPASTFLYEDFNPKTQAKYAVCFKSYPDDVSGAADALRIATNTQSEKDAFKSGIVRAVSTAMYDAHYYGSPYADRQKAIDFHVSAILKNATIIAQALGEPLAIADGGINGVTPGGDTGNGLGLLALAALGGFLALHGVAGDEAGFEDTDFVKTNLETTNVSYERLDNDVKRGIKSGKIDASKRESLGYRWSYQLTDWHVFYEGVQASGVSPWDSSAVNQRINDYRTALHGFQVEVSKAMGGDVTPGPPVPTPPPSVLPDVGALGFGGTVIAGLTVAAIVTFSRK